jgi:hypothetical protein
VKIIQPDWASPPKGVEAAFTERTGGVSAAPFDTLNLGAHVGDDPAAVAENRRRVRTGLALPSEPVWMEQVHGADVVDLDAYASRESDSRKSDSHAGDTNRPPRADAAVTREPGRVCAILVADCMPVLFAARDGSAVGAAHAGWRGLARGVLEATVSALRCPPRELLAWLGPAISQPTFEVGEDVYEAFVARDPGDRGAFEHNARGRWQCDLYALARRRLAALGVGQVSGGAFCTVRERERFFSFRRDGRCGRMAALIWRTEHTPVRAAGGS